MEAQASGIEWRRLLAAVAYQESQQDPIATSETGVRGLMQLTEETARHLGVVDRLDARESAIGAAKYLADPAQAAGPDRGAGSHAALRWPRSTSASRTSRTLGFSPSDRS